jgi:serine protease Do
LTVLDVVKDGPAAKAGIRLHDILTSIAGQPLADQEQLVKSVQANGEKSVGLELIREGRTRTVEITPERRKTTAVRGGAGNVSDRRYSFLQFHPGTVVPNDARNLRWYYDFAQKTPTQPGQAYSWHVGEKPGTAQQPAANDVTSKRLDELDSEIKKLRKAIEELSSAVKNR